MALVKICKLLILRSSDRHFRPILAPKSRFSATCLARHYKGELVDRGGRICPLALRTRPLRLTQHLLHSLMRPAAVIQGVEQNESDHNRNDPDNLRRGK